MKLTKRLHYRLDKEVLHQEIKIVARFYMRKDVIHT